MLRTLSDRCWSCHGTTNHPDAEVSLVTRDPLLAPAVGRAHARRATQRTQLPVAQMESEEMNPGRSCNTCHEQVNAEQGGDAPIYRIAGTVFPTAHETDDCETAIPPGVTVDVVDANGKVTTLEVNAVGNFFSDDHTIAFPFTTIVRYAGRAREMALPADDGSCNDCHTQAGTEDAPGRVLLP